MRKFSILFATVLTLSSTSFGQSNEALLRQLLDLPAPARIIREKAESEKDERPLSFFDDASPPSDDAPIEDVLDYWKSSSLRNGNKASGFRPHPSEENTRRLLEFAQTSPEILDSLVKILPPTAEVSSTVAEIYTNSQNAEGIEDSWRESIRKWLKFNSDRFLDELLREARTARDHKTYGSVTKEEALRALARYGWEDARPVLDGLANDSSNKRTSALAKVLIYEHAVAANDTNLLDNFRNELKRIVSDRNAEAYARDAAAEALFSSSWLGQDEWYLSLFEDETLLHPVDGSRLYSPLTTLSAKDPKKWVTILTSLLGNKSRAVHNAAVQGLMEIESRESLTPLIPWLSNPDWADAKWSGSDRTALMQRVDDFDLRESIPGLIWVVENDDDNVHWAARTLGVFKDERAGPALRNALKRINEETYRKTIIEALISCKGLTIEEMVESLLLYAEITLRPKDLEKIQNRGEYDDETPLPVSISIGWFISDSRNMDEQLIRAVVERENLLRKQRPELAKALSAIMSKWEGRLVDIELLSGIENGSADVETIIGSLARRKELRERIPNELATLRGRSGTAGALAACIMEDAEDVRSAVLSNDLEKSIAAMACARLLRIQLPISEVGRFLAHGNKLMSLAADRYLESDDSPEARRMVLERQPNQARLLGARATFNPAGHSDKIDYNSPLSRLLNSVGMGFSFSSDFTQLNKAENRLRDELKTDSKLETIYALLPNHDSGQQIVRIYKDRATFTYEDDAARRKEKSIAKADLDRFLQALGELDLENFYPKHVNCHHDCYSREFVAFTRSGGRRIFSGSGMFALGPLDLLANFFESGKFATRYHFQDRVADLEVVVEDSKLKPILALKNGDDFRVLISDEEKKDLIDEELRTLDKQDEAQEDLDYDEEVSRSRARRRPRAYEHFAWRELKDGKLGNVVSEPTGITYLSDRLTFPEVDDLESGNSIWQSRWRNYQIRAGGKGDEQGLWLVNQGEKRKIANGWFGRELVVAGDWVVASKTETDWSDPNYLVRINLRTGIEIKIVIPPADDLDPIAFVPSHNKILISRTDPSSTTEHFLLDPATGRSEKVTGQFQPLAKQHLRPLQSTGKPDKYWATVYSGDKNETDIGIYDSKTFSFESILKLPEILISSDAIWVDQNSSKIYFIYSASWQTADLLSIPLPDLNKVSDKR